MKQAKCLVLLIVLALFCVNGCMVMGGRVSHRTTLTEENVKAILPGKTTRKEVLDRLGPPLAIARRGKVMVIPGEGVRREGWQEVQADTFFELFADRKTGEEHSVHYYSTTEATKWGLCLLGFLEERTTLRQDRLWFLLNDRTGIVEDYVFRQGG